LDSHPEIHGIDEMEFNQTRLIDYTEDASYHPNVSFKLPAYASLFSFMKQLSGLKVLWCIRDPRDVIASMIRLRLNLAQNISVPWASHPLGAHREIINCLPVLSNKTKRKLYSYVQQYEQICRTHPAQRSFKDVVYTAALCWRVKNELLPVYKNKRISYKMVFYERLISIPEKAIREILEFVGLGWHENVLKHHLYHSGISVGGTDNTRPIDSSNTGKWKTVLTPTALSTVKELCSRVASKFGYELV
jgi:hypothetical protein